MRKSTGKTITLRVEASKTTAELKCAIEEKDGTLMTYQRLVFANEELDDSRTLASYNMRTGSSLNLLLRIVGGGKGVLKKHTKKSEKVASLVKRSVALVLQGIGEEDQPVDGEAPALLQPFLQPMQQSLVDHKAKAAAGEEGLLKNALDRLTDEQLTDVIEILSKRGRTEDKLFQVAVVMMNDIQRLEVAANHCQKMKMQMVSSFFELYATEYSTEKGTSLVYKNEAFFAHVLATQNYRRGIRQTSSGSAGVSGEREPAGNCVIA